jgi:hypothetical protein
MPITIDNSGQTVTLNPPYSPATPDDSLQKITAVYFAKKTVTNVGTTQAPNLNVNFTRIDSLHTQQDAAGTVLNYDSILGKTVYLVIETSNMATLSIDAVIRPCDNALTGNTDTLSLMKFNTETQVYEATRLLTAEVGNFDALNNRSTTQNPTGSHTHYTNLADHSDKAIIKLQLRPATRADFNTWARNIAAAQNGRVNLEVVVERNDNQQCAYGTTATEEVNEAGVFLNTDALGRFRIVNRNFYCIYHESNVYNFNTNFTDNDRNQRNKPISRIINNSNNRVNYFYYDIFDNEYLICETEKYTTQGKNTGVGIASAPVSYLRAVAVAEAISNRHLNPQRLTPQQQQDFALIQNTVDYSNYQAEGVDVRVSYIFENGVISKGYPNGTYPDRYYSNQNENIVLINAQIGADQILENINGYNLFTGINFVSGNIRMRFSFYKTRRRYADPNLFAGILGALAKTNFNQVVSPEARTYLSIICQGFSFKDGTCFPSVSHTNGKAFDTNYLSTEVLEDRLTNALWFYGINVHLRGNTSWKPRIDHSTYHDRHEDHLHSGGNNFNMNFIETLLP